MPWPGAIRAFFVKGCFGKTLHFLCRPAPGGTFSLFARPGHQKTYPPVAPPQPSPVIPERGMRGEGEREKERFFYSYFFPFFLPMQYRHGFDLDHAGGLPARLFFRPRRAFKNKRQKTFSHGEKIISICLSAFFCFDPTD